MYVLDRGTRFVIPQFCHPDEASNASGRKDLGQLRVCEAGAGLRVRALRAFHCYNSLNISEV